MKRPFQFFLLLIVVALVAAGACLLTRHFVPAIHQESTADSHVWIHQQLRITPEQEKSIEAIEHRYSERRMKLAQAIQLANEELANAILEDQAASPRVNAVIEKIHAAQGELQMLTIAHVFEMKAALTPEQWDRLLKLTSQALKSQTGDSH